eukprot:CAMPEP_0172030556 /NCGR_PEP_ID=MMETSP1041-20130122/18791_1 /TAXON_ID=464988 /ORGANISM="Hemiselmis andersenii, Strain CCMP439" /LENGTH=31 /DNA_ID= /DNA_START= /DNA_END= /DNA_ORIENTATION=
MRGMSQRVAAFTIEKGRVTEKRVKKREVCRE